MKRVLFAAMMMAAITLPAAADVGVSVDVGQPGFYGHIDIGDSFPRPQLIYPQPVMIEPVPMGIVREPLYLHVPPRHARYWARHCGRYNACGQPVYFVRDDWYDNVYVPRYRERYRGGWREHYDGHHGGRHKNHGRGHGRGHHDD